jgi:plastocyanin
MTTETKTPKGTRYVVIAALIALAFFGAYGYASAQRSQSTQGDQALTAAGPTDGSQAAAQGGAGGAGGAGGGSGCSCCGGGAAQAPASAQAPKSAKVAGSVQKISVDVSRGYYDPSTIVLKAGVPAEITFSQASGCTAQVQSQQLGFFEDLSTGPKTVKLGALQPGEYQFSCGMQMVFGKIVVK